MVLRLIDAPCDAGRGRYGTVREPAAQDAQDRPLCPYCLINDPINREERVRCRRQRRVRTHTTDGPVCAIATEPPWVLETLNPVTASSSTVPSASC